MKNILILVVLLISSCTSLTLISPGITSENHLLNATSIKFEEASFYGSNFYQFNVFYLEDENIRLVLNDPNNILNSKIKVKFEENISDTDFLLLAEICFDKEKFKQRDLDLEFYEFELNGNKFNDRIEFIYPYSYSMKGNKYNLERPILINDNYPNQKNVIKTADEFIACSRSFIKFKKKYQIESKNSLKIVTPRKSIINFQFYVKNGKFQIQNNDDINIKIKLKSEV